MGNVRLSVGAIRDLDEIIKFIVIQNPSAAQRLRLRFDQTIRLLADNPLIGHQFNSCKGIAYRVFTVESYVIYYAPRRYGIFVARIVHGARNRDSLL